METIELYPEIATKFFEIRIGIEVSEEEIFEVNKRALMRFMNQYEIDRVVVAYSGSGDNGGIDNVTFFNGDYVNSYVERRGKEICLIGMWERIKEEKLLKLPPTDAFGYMAEVALALTGHEGWELDDGGDGEVTFVLSSEGRLVVRIEHNEYYTQVNRHEYEL